jgi:hypothetical protein
MSFIDVGGNVGKFYDELSKKYIINNCEIVEASGMLCEYMRDKFKNNPNISIHNFGLSDEEGVFYFGEEGIMWFENSGTDGSSFDNLNFGLSACHFVPQDNLDFPGATKFYNGSYFLNNINKIPAKDIKLVKVDTENRDVQIVTSMKNYFLQNDISPIILFENNYRYFLSIEEAQYLIDDLCSAVGYYKVDLLKEGENVFLLPIKNI